MRAIETPPLIPDNRFPPDRLSLPYRNVRALTLNRQIGDGVSTASELLPAAAPKPAGDCSA